MKKLSVLLLLLFLLPLQLQAAELGYQVDNQTTETVSGVTQTNITATVTNDAGTTSKQNVTILKPDDSLQMTTWSYFNESGKLVNKDVLSLARDFNLKNPDYEVIAGVNGDYFTTGSTISANMIFGSKLIKADNHSKYLSIELNSNGQFVKSQKTISYGNYKLYLYDRVSHALLKVVAIENINDSTIEAGQTGVFYNYDSVTKPSGLHYSYTLNMQSFTNSQSFYYATNPIEKNSVIETSTTKVSVLSKDESVNALLPNSVIKIQKEAGGVGESNTLLGVGSQILDNDTIKPFSEIGDQNEGIREDRHPRTGIGFDSQNRPVLITVDGRQTGFSQGVNLREFAKIMQANGLKNGFNLDGGGSTQAIIKSGEDFKIINSPSEGGPTTYRAVSNAVFFIKPKAKALVQSELTDETLMLTLPSTNYKVLLNGIQQNISQTTVTFELDSKIDNAVSVVDLTTNQVVFNQVIYAFYVKETVYPTITKTEGILKSNTFEIEISFDDPERLIDRMYVIYTEKSTQKIALVQYAGLRKATFDLIEPGTHNFEVHYELKTGEEFSYEFTYEYELPTDPETPLEPETDEPLGTAVILAITLPIGALGVILVAVFLLRKKKI
ncbi:phosphodiester glycosidase family protein [Acholeplasma vituli]|uniref:Phosphodiester glycosidase family protein n=1 Tax=Paracholeplasma vituli TaxID=69473 RepID=A0ABT2PV03_9MOLU|nr:phosphodiester glycosidase family protein [Paracholeplasma vituli]MCU0104266.1 phosphodiester glycosidase family protein [Paracholeplasma vituli]